jgi:predicted RNase H-like nuclease
LVRIAGVDGCRGGWVVAESDDELKGIAFNVFSHFADVVAKRYELAIVDIPIGLPETRSRSCDVAARQFLGKPRSNSVFPAPHRSALSAKTREAASALNESAIGTRIGAQGWAIVPKIREVDLLITIDLQKRVREAHPEVTFGSLRGLPSGPSGLKYRKSVSTGDGENERLDLLAKNGVAFDIGAEKDRFRAAVARDDVVDAAACLVSAWRTLHGTALLFPSDTPEYDARGLRMEIVA